MERGCVFEKEVDGPGVDTYGERRFVFWTGCVPNRVAIACAVVVAGIRKVRELELILSVYMGAWGVLFLAYFVRGTQLGKMEEKAKEATTEKERKRWEGKVRRVKHGNFGGEVWWQWLRPVHGVLLVLYSSFTLAGWERAYWFAIADVAAGAASGILYYHLRPRIDCRLQP